MGRVILVPSIVRGLSIVVLQRIVARHYHDSFVDPSPVSFSPQLSMLLLEDSYEISGFPYPYLGFTEAVPGQRTF